ncbi:MAG: TonB-dependent receptor [Porticoccaceae bacterium]
MSISAISGERLVEQKLTTLEEITSSIPGLVFANSQQNTPILTLRGIGFNESSLGVYPATSLYVDEIPLPFPAMSAHSAYDLERVEVLKGPQGVLFGQNSTGGAINFIAAKPTDEFAYGGDVGYGRFNRFETNAFVSGGLSDNASARLAIQNVQADEWQKSVTRDAENGEEDYTAARLSLRFEPTENAEINFNVNGWTDKSDPQALQFIAAVPRRFDAVPDYALRQVAVPYADEDARSADWTGELSGDKEFIQTSVRGDFDLNESMTLTALLAHSEYEQDQIQDGDGQNLETADFRTYGDIESTFAEIRLAGDSDAGIRWVVGANYEDSSTSENQLQAFRDNTSARPSNLLFNRVRSELQQEIESYALFGNIDYDLTESLTLKLGARYTETTNDANMCLHASPNGPGTPDLSEGIGSNGAGLFNMLGGLFGTVPFTPIGLDDCLTLNYDGVPGFPFIDTLDEDNVSWRAGVDYQFNEDTLVYANVSQGYKAGSYPSLSSSNFESFEPVTQESVLAYEVGFKKSMADARVQLNGAVFYYDYEDKQERGKIQLPVFGTLDRLINVPESTVQGIEADVVALLTDKLTLTAAVTYIDSQVDEYTGFNVLGGVQDFSDENIPYTPEFTYSLDLDYRTPLSQGGSLFMGMSVSGQSDADAVFDGDDLALDPANVAAGFQKSITENYLVVDSYATLGARIGYESADERWKIMLWGKNITDEYYWNSVVSTSESGARMAGRPRTYGLTLGYRY